MRICKQCGGSMEGKISTAVYCSRSCFKKAWYEANKEKVAAWKKAWREANPEYNKAYNKAWREANPEYDKAYKKAYREANKEKEAARHKAWYEANKEKERIIAQRYRARKAALPATFTRKQWKQAREYFDNKCVYCGEPLKRAHQEHFIPLSKGGAYTKDNIVPSCPKCNFSKGNKNPLDWLVEQEHGLVAYVRTMQYLENV